MTETEAFNNLIRALDVARVPFSNVVADAVRNLIRAYADKPVDTVNIRITRLPHAANLPLPSYETAGAAGMDLMAAISEPVNLYPGERRIVPTGISIALPHGYEAQVRSRSGLAAKHGICVLNSPGTVDADYRGEVGVILHNTDQSMSEKGRKGTPFVIEPGMRIAQLVIAPVSRAVWDEMATLDETERGAGGFGSTGV